jgi:hypothetical protein
MEPITQAIEQHNPQEKLTTRGQLARQPNSSQPLSRRQAAIAGLIQKTQSRRGLPLISVGYELNNALAGWEDALAAVPDDYLSRAYDRAADAWDWHDTRHPFTPDAIRSAYTVLVVEDRQRAEADRRNAARRNPDTYACWHCLDLGYQQVFIRERERWYQSVRPCCCEIAPPSQRRAEPLQEPEWIRNRYGQYVKRADLVKFGTPNDTFESFSFAVNGVAE